jgi:hypothetical protein
VEVGVSSDHQQQHQVPYRGQEVNPQEQYKEQSFNAGIIRKANENKLSDGAVVPPSHLWIFPWNIIERGEEVSDFSIL